ncbi:DUF3592 domain-containing protein [Massilia sp. CCM 9210]|uniref:DUF3592 domain-containing protein n=1 Tax=Massilia scottii TaxID=3057166 RepID=UPI0027963CCA|nr:DUF3592 domain-containing protein [Massilia sp. CCM 9210]MDQ1815657.1 DUF3592 domain-containing protein [Massilia sp. CCM 9210]
MLLRDSPGRLAASAGAGMEGRSGKRCYIGSENTPGMDACLFTLFIVFHDTYRACRGRACYHCRRCPLPAQGQGYRALASGRRHSKRGIHFDDRRPPRQPQDRLLFSELHYLYVFGGVVRRGSRSLSGRVTSRANAIELSRPYASGQPIEVYVDKQNPHRHALVRGVNHQWWWLIAFGLCWIGAALRCIEVSHRCAEVQGRFNIV